MQRISLAISVVMGLLLAMRGQAAADDFFSSSPGPLSQSHATLDTKDQCNACHVDGAREDAAAEALDAATASRLMAEGCSLQVRGPRSRGSPNTAATGYLRHLCYLHRNWASLLLLSFCAML